MGFSEFQSTNYIDILNFPKQVSSFFESALPVRADWQPPIDGANMQDWVERFFEGHGGVSVVSKLTALYQTMDIAYNKLLDGSTTFEEVKANLLVPLAETEWKEIMSRWEYYLPLFEYLPFYPTIQEINEIFSAFIRNFPCFFDQEDLFLETQFDEKLKQVNQKLTEVDRLYIRNL